MNQERRAVDPILQDIQSSVNRIDSTIHGNGHKGLKATVEGLRAQVNAAWVLILLLLTGVLGCAWKVLGG